MMSPESSVRQFLCRVDWFLLLVQVGTGAALVGLSLATIILGMILENGLWAWVAGALLMLLGFIMLGILVLQIITLAVGLGVIVSVHHDSVWVYESPQVDLFPKTVLIPFETIVEVKRERDGIRILHGSERKSEMVYHIRPADVDEFLTLLAERCPSAFCSHPSNGEEPADGI